MLSGGRKSIELPLSDAELNFQMRRIGIEETVPMCRLVEVSEQDNPLHKFEGQTVNMDEVNFFAKRMESLTEYERKVLSEYAEDYGVAVMQDLINLTFSMKGLSLLTNAVFEAAKSLSEKVREKTGLQDDGSVLFNTAFSVNNPRLALNSLQTSTERNLQNGLKEMLNGVTHMVRNVTAHELKVKWVVNEQDAIDILTTISFLHKQLDEYFVVPQHII